MKRRRQSGQMVSRILQIAHHRNGVCGAPFYAIMFRDMEGRQMLATLFDEPGYCAVVCVDVETLTVDGVAMGANSWRGDQFEPELRAAVAAQEANR